MISIQLRHCRNVTWNVIRFMCVRVLFSPIFISIISFYTKPIIGNWLRANHRKHRYYCNKGQVSRKPRNQCLPSSFCSASSVLLPKKFNISSCALSLSLFLFIQYYLIEKHMSIHPRRHHRHNHLCHHKNIAHIEYIASRLMSPCINNSWKSVIISTLFNFLLK